MSWQLIKKQEATSLLPPSGDSHWWKEAHSHSEPQQPESFEKRSGKEHRKGEKWMLVLIDCKQHSVSQYPLATNYLTIPQVCVCVEGDNMVVGY